MHVAKLLHNLFDKACKIDSRIKQILFLTTDTLIHCKQLSITSIGRHLPRAAKIKNNIKSIDRLFGNKTLHEKGFLFYERICNYIIKNKIRPVILVDASRLTRCGTYHVLRASIAIQGRSLTLYDEVYLSNEYQQSKTHLQFLNKLKRLLPSHCRPIIITDAGFRNPWFKHITALGWDFIGRVRNSTHYCCIGKTSWQPVVSLYHQAKFKAVLLGQVVLAKSNSTNCFLYLVKQRKKYRIKANLAGNKVQSSHSKKHERRENEPWLIASSLIIDATEVMSLYKKRMQIEQTFRDLKNGKNGLGFCYSRTFDRNRLSIALLIANLAMIALWLFAIAAKRLSLHYSYQANTERNRNVLSMFTIGWQTVINYDIRFQANELKNGLNSILIANSSFYG